MQDKYRKTLFLAVIVLIAAAWGYSRINPKFAAHCDTFYKTYLKPACDAGLKFCQQIGDKVAEKTKNPFEKNLSRRNVAPME